jgi:hypothetical protein
MSPAASASPGGERCVTSGGVRIRRAQAAGSVRSPAATDESTGSAYYLIASYGRRPFSLSRCAPTDSVTRVNDIAEPRRRTGGCARVSDPIGQCGVRCHHGDLLRSIVGPDQPHDLVVGRVGARRGRVSYADHRRANRRRRRLLEHNCHVLAFRRGPTLELVHQADHRAPAVLPPTVRASPDHVHAVDNPPHTKTVRARVHQSPTSGTTWQRGGWRLERCERTATSHTGRRCV